MVFTWSNRICCKISNSIQSFVKATKLLGNNEINWQTSNRANRCFIWEIKRIKFKWYLFFNEKYDDRLHSTIFPLKKKIGMDFVDIAAKQLLFSLSLPLSLINIQSIHSAAAFFIINNKITKITTNCADCFVTINAAQLKWDFPSNVFFPCLVFSSTPWI